MNAWTIKNHYPLPLIPSLIDQLRDCTLFTGFDIEWGYNEVLVKPEDHWKAAFMLPPEQAAELLPWYMQWSRDLAAEMHQRRLVQDKARRTLTLPISYRPCDCTTEWRCEPHDACFIHDSCFCPGSGSFPPVKPPRS